MKRIALALAISLFAFSPSTTWAMPIGFDFEILGGTPGTGSPDFNVAFYTITNTSAAGVVITDWSLTIGDTDYNYDWWSGASALVDSNSPLIWTFITPDFAVTGGLRTDEVLATFTGFDAGDSFRTLLDVDIDNRNTPEFFLRILFNNGHDTPNAVVTIGFELNGAEADLSLTLPDNGNTLLP